MKAPKRNLLAEFEKSAGAAEMLLVKDGAARHTFTAALDSLMPDPNQPRKRFDPEALQSFALSLQTEGLLHPILVRRGGEGGKKWIIVAGERRWRAATIAAWQEINCIEVDSRLAQRIALIENLQRVDLSPVEEAQGIADNMASGLTLADVATMIGRSKSDVSETVRLLDLAPSIRERLSTGKIDLPKATLLEITKAGSAIEQEEMCAKVLAGGLTSKAARELRSTGEDDPKGGRKSGARTVSPKTVNTFTSRILALPEPARLTPEVRDELRALASAINKILRGASE